MISNKVKSLAVFLPLTLGLIACSGSGGSSSEGVESNLPAEVEVSSFTSIDYSGPELSNVSGSTINVSQSNGSLESSLCFGNSSEGFKSEHFEVFSVDDLLLTSDLKAAASHAEYALDVFIEKLSLTETELFGSESIGPISICLFQDGSQYSGSSLSKYTFQMQSPNPGDFSLDLQSRTAQLLRHELVHTIQKRVANGSIDKWFSEGIATVLSGQAVSSTPSEIDDYIAKLNSGEITLAVPELRTHQLYEDNNSLDYSDLALAVFYLFANSDLGGAGYPLTDVAELWRQVTIKSSENSADTFEEAFDEIFNSPAHPENTIQISFANFRDNYSDILESFRESAWIDGTVIGDNSSIIDYVILIDKGRSYLDSRFYAVANVDNEGFSLMHARLDSSKEYDAYFVNVISEVDNLITSDTFGPITLDVNSVISDSQSGNFEFDITGLESTRYVEED